MKEYKPDVLFSKGGYVSVPVVRAAASLHIPCIIHESDMTPGLANKICIPAAKKVCCNFPETLEKLPPDKAVLTGTPIRDELLHGSRSKGLEICGFDGAKPVLLVIGGSLGASSVNQTIRDNLDALLAHFDIIHICGKDKVDNLKLTIPGYKQFEFVKEELCHLLRRRILSSPEPARMQSVNSLHCTSPRFLCRSLQPAAAETRSLTQRPSRSRATAWSCRTTSSRIKFWTR